MARLKKQQDEGKVAAGLAATPQPPLPAEPETDTLPPAPPEPEPPGLPGLSTAEVVEATGVSAPSLSEWCALGYIHPSVAAPSKQGGRARWSEEDVANIARLRALVQSVLAFGRVASVSEAAKALDRASPEHVVLLTTKGVRVAQKSDLIARLFSISLDPMIVFPPR